MDVPESPLGCIEAQPHGQHRAVGGEAARTGRRVQVHHLKTRRRRSRRPQQHDGKASEYPDKQAGGGVGRGKE